tara:strand:- start:1061 stop:1264 length:204 start_codon:yes stop_codon:yes gene_type:complete
MQEHVTTVIVGLAGPVILGVFGFLWRVNSKLSGLEQKIKAHEDRIAANRRQLNQHFDKAFTIRKNID